MAENLKYNLKDELLAANDKLTGSLSLLGMTMLTQPMYNNSMRSVMFTSHLKQFVNLKNPDFPGFFTNGENVVGKYSSGYKKTKKNLTVFRKVAKFEDILDEPNVYTLFVYDKKEDKYDIITRKDSENLTEVFGFDYQNDVIDSYDEGDKIEKGTVLYKSSSYDESMNYGYGKNVTMMYTTDPYTSEDACVVSRSLAESMQSIEIVTESIGINQNDFLLNLYGDEDEYKPFPDIGEVAIGELAAKRTLFNNQLLFDFKDSALNKIQGSDVVFYGSGKVIDIDIYCNNEELEDTPFNAQIIKYLESQTKYYQEISDTCEEIMKSGSKYSHELDYLYKRSREFLDEDKKWKDNDSVFGNLLVDITIKSTSKLQVGQKLSGRYGNKSVISQIREDEDMPFYYDDNGNKVIIDLLLNVLAIVNRTTAFPMFELSMNYICNKVRAQMQMTSSMEEREKLLFGIIEDFNEKQAYSMKKTYDSIKTKKEKEAYINDAMMNRIFIHQQPMWESKPIFFRLLDVYKKYDFLTPYDIFINKWGRQIKIQNPMYIGEMYIIKLKQTSRKGFSVRGTGSINGKGLPERSYKNKSFTELRSSTPIRFGEFESLNEMVAMSPEDIQLFHLLYRTSVKGRRDLARQLLIGDDEFKIDSSYTSRVAEIFAVILKSLGLRLEFVDDEEYLQEYDDTSLSVHTVDGVDYLCTDYQFMLSQRRKDIEDEILSERGIIDIDELNDLVMEQLKTRSFIIGPDDDEIDSMPGYQPDTVSE